MTEINTEKRVLDSVVTSENLAQFQAHKLDIQENKPESVKEEPKVEPVIEVKKEEPVKEEKEEKNPINERMRELTDRAKAEKAKREEVEKERDELKAKLNPPKVEELLKPDRTQFEDPFDYAEKLADYTTKKALAERDETEAKARQEADKNKVISTWNERLAEAKKEVPDFEDKINSSNIVVSDQVRDAILESEVGPKILIHFVEHPEEAEKIGKMTVGKAYLALGKLEAKLSEVKAPSPSPEPKPAVEVSKAPAPISPLKGAGAPADLPVNGKGEWTGTLDQYKEARRNGKIK